MILEEEKRTGAPMRLDLLIVLSLLRDERRLSVAQAAAAIQKDEAAARIVLERLVEAGLVEAHGVKKGRIYTLGAKVYRAIGQSAGYVRQAGFDPIQQEQMVLQYVHNHGRITAIAMCDRIRAANFWRRSRRNLFSNCLVNKAWAQHRCPPPDNRFSIRWVM